MLKEFCSECVAKEECTRIGECLSLRIKQRLRIIDYNTLSEISDTGGMNPEADEPIIYYDPNEENDPTEAYWI